MIHIDDLELFDSCVTLGEFAYSRCETRITGRTIGDYLSRYHISEALVHEQHARTIHPREDGNRRLMETIADVPSVHPVWVLDPPLEAGREPAEALVQEMLAAGVRACRLMMKDIPPMEVVWSDLLSALENRRVACFLDFGGVPTTGTLTDSDVRGVVEISEFHPKLPLILSHLMGGLGIHPALPYLLRRRANLYLDTAGLMDYARRLAHDGFADRVIFATGAPFADPGLFVHTAQYDHVIDAATAKLICGDNLRRLLGAVA